MDNDTLHQLTPRRGANLRRRSTWFAVALVLHIVGALAYRAWPTRAPAKEVRPPTNPAPISLTEHSQAVQASRRARATLAHKPLAPAAPRPKPKPKPQPLKGQIVEVARSPDDKAPKDAAYLAEHNASTEHETRSRHIPKQETNILPEPSAQEQKAQTPASIPPVDLQTPLSAPQREASQTQSARAFGTEAKQAVSKQSARDKLALRQNEQNKGLQNRERLAARDGQLTQEAQPSAAPAGPRAAPSPQKNLTMADLIPSVGTLARLSGGPSNDALQDVDEGEGTFLNAREFKYASYFMRIKRGVSQQWHATEEYQRRDPSGNIYGFRSRTTDVRVTLDQFGALKAVTLAASSGVDFLDRAAIQAFESAAPFPNPPRALLDSADEIKFQFSFVLSMGRQSFFAEPY